MRDMTPRCPHCQNLTIVGSVGGQLVAVCTACDNGYAKAASGYPDLMNFPGQQFTRQQVEDALSKVLSHLNGVASNKQDALVKDEQTLPENRDEWTEDDQTKAASLRDQRMVYAGLLQGSSSFRDLVLKALGLTQSTLSSGPAAPADPAENAPGT